MFLRRFICVWITISFLSTLVIPPQRAYSQTILNLPQPGTMVSLSSAYTPVLIKGLQINPANPLSLNFIVATGNSQLTAQDPELKQESEKLIKYFFAALTLPEKDVWVNLSPYEKDRIIPKATGETEMGRDMLAQDYILKQITASLIYPEKGIGKDFWNKIYAESYQRFGTAQVPVNTFNKVWIVADKASVYETKDTVLVVDSHLKVMLEEDYLALQKHQTHQPTNTLASNIVRQIILPALEKEVNGGRNFANLRQIFHSLILAKWYKETLKTALLNQVYSNKNKVGGLSFNASAGDPQRIYQQYLKAYKKGVFNYIKEDIDQTSKQPIPRKYFSGGVSAAMIIQKAPADQAMNNLRLLAEGGSRLYKVSEISKADPLTASQTRKNTYDSAMLTEKNRTVLRSKLQMGPGAFEKFIFRLFGNRFEVPPTFSSQMEKEGKLLGKIIIDPWGKVQASNRQVVIQYELGKKERSLVIDEENVEKFSDFVLSDSDGPDSLYRIFKMQLAHKTEEFKVLKKFLIGALEKRTIPLRQGLTLEKIKGDKRFTFDDERLFEMLDQLKAKGILDRRGNSFFFKQSSLKSLNTIKDEAMNSALQRLMRPIKATIFGFDEQNIDLVIKKVTSAIPYVRDRARKALFKGKGPKFEEARRILKQLRRMLKYSRRTYFREYLRKHNIHVNNPDMLENKFVSMGSGKLIWPAFLAARKLGTGVDLKDKYDGPTLEFLSDGQGFEVTSEEKFAAVRIRSGVGKLLENNGRASEADVEKVKPVLEAIERRDNPRNTNLLDAIRDMAERENFQPKDFVMEELMEVPGFESLFDRTSLRKTGKEWIYKISVEYQNIILSVIRGPIGGRKTGPAFADGSDAVWSFEWALERQARELGYEVNRRTKFVLHLGDTVDQSRYYKVYNKGFLMGEDNILLLPVKTMPADLEQIVKMGRLSKKVIGFNITSPHKINIIRYLDGLDETAQRVGAVQTVLKEKDGKLKGYNYSGEGWVYWYTKFLGKSLQGKKIVVLGAGGAARSLIQSIFQKAPDAQVAVYDWKEETADALNNDLKSHHPNWDLRVVTRSSLNTYIGDSNIVINLTGSGKSYSDQNPPVPDIDYHLLNGKIAIDANYRFRYDGPQNAFLKLAQKAGATVYNGLGFSVSSIVPDYQLFTGKTVSYQALMDFAKTPIEKGGPGMQDAAMGASEKLTRIINDFFDKNHIEFSLRIGFDPKSSGSQISEGFYVPHQKTFAIYIHQSLSIEVFIMYIKLAVGFNEDIESKLISKLQAALGSNYINIMMTSVKLKNKRDLLPTDIARSIYEAVVDLYEGRAAQEEKWKALIVLSQYLEKHQFTPEEIKRYGNLEIFTNALKTLTGSAFVSQDGIIRPDLFFMLRNSMVIASTGEAHLVDPVLGNTSKSYRDSMLLKRNWSIPSRLNGIQEKILEDIRDILFDQQELEPEKILPESKFESDFNMDSLEFTHFIVSVDKFFGVNIPNEAVSGNSTVWDFIKYLELHASAAMMANEAEHAHSPQRVTRGGIDFNASRLNLQKTGSGIQIKFDPAMIAQFKKGNFDGILPVITGITPIANIYPLLGLKEPENNKKLAV